MVGVDATPRAVYHYDWCALDSKVDTKKQIKIPAQRARITH